MKTVQFLIDTFYRLPKATFKTWSRFGGYSSYRTMRLNQKLMEAAALRLPVVQSYLDGLPVYFLTGKKYLSQTLFCIQSLTKVTQQKFRFILIDDGSFDSELSSLVKDMLPEVEIVLNDDTEDRLSKILPERDYPHLHHKRKVYPHIKKLTDVHTLPGNPWKLVLDSDMLFWQEPLTMINWLNSPDKPLYMQDCQNSYGYSMELMADVCGCEIRDLVNVGMIGLNSAEIDWKTIENWIETLESRQGTSYYLEQALTAMLIQDKAAEILPASAYVVNPDVQTDSIPTCTLHHYVDLSKKDYFNHAWRIV